MELAAGSGMAGKKMRFICNTLHGWKVDTGVDVMLSSFAQLGPLLWLSREYTQQRSCMRSFADNPPPPPPHIAKATLGASPPCLKAHRGHGCTGTHISWASYAKLESTYAGLEDCPAVMQHLCLA